MPFIYRTEFTNDKDDDFTIDVRDSYSGSRASSGSVTDSFVSPAYGFKLNYANGDDTHIGLYPSTLTFSFIAQDDTEYDTIRAIADQGASTVHVIVYKNETDLFWEGFLNLLPSAWGYTAATQVFTFEAFDHIALLKERNMWEQWPELFGINKKRLKDNYSLTYLGKYATHNGLGFRANNTPSVGSDNQIPVSAQGWNYEGNSYSKGFLHEPGAIPQTSLLGVVYSCLYDFICDEIGQKDIYAASWDIPTNHSPVQPNSSSHTNWFTDKIKVNIEEILWDYDNLVHTGPFNTISHPTNREDLDLYQLLTDLVKFNRCRLFQRDGVYHLIQVECWEGYNPSPAPIINYSQNDNRLDTTNPAGALVATPRHHTTSGYSGVNSFTMDFGSGYSTRMENINISLTEPFREVTLKIAETMGGELKEFKQVINPGSHNLFTNQRSNTYELEIETFSLEEVNHIPTSGTSATYRHGGHVTDAGLKIHLINMLAEHNNYPREKITATLSNVTYSFMLALDFEGKRYLPQRASYNANDNSWECEWLEFTKSNNGIGTTRKGVG